MKRATTRMATIAVVGLTALAASASPAAAAPNPTPHGLCGAQNMVNPNALPHMLEAMALHTDEHGDAGMFGAIAHSICRR